MKTCSKCTRPETEVPFSPNRRGTICNLCRNQSERQRLQTVVDWTPEVYSNPYGWWVTGLTDGEGSFVAEVYTREKTYVNRSGGLSVTTDSGFTAYYTLALRDDGAPTVEKVASYFGCGRINDKKSKTHPQKKFTVSRLEDLLTRVVPQFETYPLQSRKARDFEAWKHVLQFVRDNLYGRKKWIDNHAEALSDLRTLCKQVRAARAYPEAGLVLQ